MPKSCPSLTLLGFPQGGGEERFFVWIDREFQFLLDIIKTFGDYAVSVCFFSVGKILKDEGCDHISSMGRSSFKFGPAASLEEASRNVKVIRAHFMRDFWAISGREASQKIAYGWLAKVNYPYTFYAFPSVLAF